MSPAESVLLLEKQFKAVFRRRPWAVDEKELEVWWNRGYGNDLHGQPVLPLYAHDLEVLRDIAQHTNGLSAEVVTLHDARVMRGLVAGEAIELRDDRWRVTKKGIDMLRGVRAIAEIERVRRVLTG